MEKSTLTIGETFRYMNYIITLDEDDSGIERMHIAIPDENWKICIPSTFDFFVMLTLAISDFRSDDEERKKKGDAVLAHYLNNIFSVSSFGNIYLHKAVSDVITAFMFPELVTEGTEDYEYFVSSMKQLISDFLSWRKMYFGTAKEPTEKEMKQDEIAEQAMEVLNNTEKAES